MVPGFTSSFPGPSASDPSDPFYPSLPRGFTSRHRWLIVYQHVRDKNLVVMLLNLDFNGLFPLDFESEFSSVA
jgi:hypothetical protein